MDDAEHRNRTTETLGGAQADGPGEGAGSSACGSETAGWLRDALDLSGALCVLLGPDYTLLDCNEPCAAAFGLRREDVPGRSLSFLVGSELFASAFRRHVDRALAGEASHFELWLDLPATGRRRLAVACAPTDGPAYGGRGVILAARDTTTTERLRQELLQTREFMTTIVDSVPVALFTVTAGRGRVLFWNRPAEDLFGMRAQLVVGRTVAEIFSAEQAGALRRLDGLALERRAPLVTEDEAIDCGAGRPVRAHTVRVPVYDADGEPRLVLYMASDRTEERRWALARDRWGMLQQTLALCARDLLAGREEGALATVLGRLLNAAGAGRVSVFENFRDPVDGLCGRQLQEISAHGCEPRQEVPLLRHAVYGVLAPDWERPLAGGEVISGLPEDFSPAVAELMHARSIRSLLVIPINVLGRWWGVMAFGDTRTPRRWDREDVLFLRTSAEIVGAHLERTSVERELRASHDGLERRVRERTADLERTNALLGAEIRERKAVAAALTRARDEATAASTAKDRFLANMSHELRTPLNGVLGMAQLMLTTRLTPEQREMLQVCLQSTRGLLRIVNDLLQLSTIDQGLLEIRSCPFGLRRMLTPLLRGMTDEAARRGLALECAVHPELPDELVGDAGRVQQVLVNLLTNALKFTPKGRIDLLVEPHEPPSDDGTPGKVRFTVRDTGVGIAPEKHEAIFDRFSLGEDFMTKRYGGPGLGLAISREIVQRMGGRIWVDSAPGAGAAFHFVLPLLEARRDARPHPEAPACATCPAASALLDPATCGTEPPPTGLRASTGEPLRVLLVEDEPVSRLVALRALQSLGLEVGVAENGDEALQALARGGVDVVLMDMQMPRLNGEDATRRLRSGQVRGANRDVPVIGVSAFAQPRDRERALAAGMNDYLTKPYEIETLVRAVERQTGRNLRLPKETGGPDGLEKAY